MTSATTAGSALAAFIDLKDSEDQDVEKERQRKFLLQIQRTKWLAQHGKLAKAGVTSTTAGTGTGAIIDPSKSVRMKDLEPSETTVADRKKVEPEPQKGTPETHLERMKKDRTSYNSE